FAQPNTKDDLPLNVINGQKVIFTSSGVQGPPRPVEQDFEARDKVRRLLSAADGLDLVTGVSVHPKARGMMWHYMSGSGEPKFLTTSHYSHTFGDDFAAKSSNMRIVYGSLLQYAKENPDVRVFSFQTPLLSLRAGRNGESGGAYDEALAIGSAHGGARGVCTVKPTELDCRYQEFGLDRYNFRAVGLNMPTLESLFFGQETINGTAGDEHDDVPQGHLARLGALGQQGWDDMPKPFDIFFYGAKQRIVLPR
ncbi:MAG: hypothetical protein ACRCV9_07845, partial [Burkholderiaceae bacterium]